MGRDEVNGGHFGLDHDGSVLWETFLGDHADSVLVDRWGTEPAAIISGGGQVLDGSGRRLLHLGADVVPHGQEVRCGNLRPELPGRELAHPLQRSPCGRDDRRARRCSAQSLSGR